MKIVKVFSASASSKICLIVMMHVCELRPEMRKLIKIDSIATELAIAIIKSPKVERTENSIYIKMLFFLS